jgi:hypothetical protein
VVTVSEANVAMSQFLRETGSRSWTGLCDSVTDNFHVINPRELR